MKVAVGWAEFWDPLLEEAVARGRVSVLDPPLPCPPTGTWLGEVKLLRGYESLLDREREIWLLRFEDGAPQRWVELLSVESTWAASGLRGTAQVATHDDKFPPQLPELGGDQ
jgi:hypothetical protein